MILYFRGLGVWTKFRKLNKGILEVIKKFDSIYRVWTNLEVIGGFFRD
jgi:hypothetical protein